MDMENVNLKAEIRELKRAKEKFSKKEEKIAAVLYGRGLENKHIHVGRVDFQRVFSKAGENTVIDIDIAGEKENVLIYAFQKDPLSGEIIHIDFLRVDMKKEIEAEVPLIFVGEAPAVKEKGGTLVKVIDTVNVKCFPGDIPHELKVDLTKLATFEDRFTMGDLEVSKNVEILSADETVIALVAEPRSEEELEELNEKVEEDVSKVSSVAPEAEATGTGGEKK